MNATVVKRASFDAAHFLPNHPGKCANMHGHHWVVEIGIEGLVDEKSGMVTDFKNVKTLLSPIIEGFDHQVLNEFLDQPTAENIAQYIFGIVRGNLEDVISPTPIHVKFVRVWETEDSMAEVGTRGT